MSIIGYGFLDGYGSLAVWHLAHRQEFNAYLGAREFRWVDYRDQQHLSAPEQQENTKYIKLEPNSDKSFTHTRSPIATLASDPSIDSAREGVQRKDK